MRTLRSALSRILGLTTGILTTGILVAGGTASRATEALYEPQSTDVTDATSVHLKVGLSK